MRRPNRNPFEALALFSSLQECWDWSVAKAEQLGVGHLPHADMGAADAWRAMLRTL